MDFSGLSLQKVHKDTVIQAFDCGDVDLNDFLITKSIKYSNELLATSYLLTDSDNNIIAFFSIFTDSIRVQEVDFASKSAFKRLVASFVSHGKRHLDFFPAVKIGRLAVKSDSQIGGIGKAIISFIIDLVIEINEKCACKFISVDAYRISLGFYEKMGFQYFTDKDANEDTRQMYLDITPLINTIEKMDE